jgi:hypothetical protein
MDADQLRDLARRAANVIGYRQILVVGSQAVHGALPGRELPPITTMSEEADLAVVNDLRGDTPHQIEAHFGMGSPYTRASVSTRTASRCRRSPFRSDGRGGC